MTSIPILAMSIKLDMNKHYITCYISKRLSTSTQTHSVQLCVHSASISFDLLVEILLDHVLTSNHQNGHLRPTPDMFTWGFLESPLPLLPS